MLIDRAEPGAVAWLKTGNRGAGQCRAAGLPIVAVVGYSGSGKTTLLIRLIGELKRRGWRIGVLKHAHKGLDLPARSKDGEQLRQAGAEAVVVAAPDRIELLRARPATWSVAGAVERDLGEADLVLVEGFKREPLPRIEVHRSDVSQELSCPPAELFALMSDRRWPLDVPQFAAKEWPLLCDLLENTWLIPRARKPQLLVDGRSIPLNDFAARYLAGAVRGLLCHLKGLDTAAELRLEIEGEELCLINGEPVVLNDFLRHSIRGAVVGLISALRGVRHPNQVQILIPR